MYFVGIDISKFKHDCAVIDEIGDTIQPSWSFRNDREGFSLLKERLDSLPGEKKIGLEATGHYGQNLKLFLEANGGKEHRWLYDRLPSPGNVHPAGTLHAVGRQGGGIG